MLAIWLLISVANQIHDGSVLRPLHRLDLGSLVPSWTFFAPRPGVTDHVLVYRDLDESGATTPWRPLTSPVRPLRAAVWNPGKRIEKLITDCASVLTGPAAGQPPVAIEAEYLLLQRLVENAPHDCRAVATQFALLDVAETRRQPAARKLISSPAVPLGAPRP